MSKITFIDVSKWNDNVDYKSVKSAGVTGVIIQCGYGMVSTQKDPYFEDNYKKAKAQGLKVGAYLYSYAESVSDAKEEANVCLKWIKGKKFDLPIYIDMEEEGLTYLGRSTLTKIATTFCKTLQNHKALLSTTVSDGMYYEVTFNGDKDEHYLDAYKKWENVCIKKESEEE